MNIIALTGYKGTGKTVAADYLIEQHGYVKHNFKGALIQEIKERFPDLLQEILVTYMDYGEYFFSIGHTVDDLFTEKPPLIRALMQNYGTDVRRKDDPYYWANQWRDTLPSSDVVVDDLRFLTEQEVLPAHASIIRLTRPDITTGGTHQSETEQLQLEPDYVIELVPGDKQALYEELDAILNV